MGKKKFTKKEVIEVWKELDRKSKKPVGTNTLCRELGIKRYNVEQLFLGESLTDVKQRYKIRTTPQETPYKHDDLLEKYDHVVTKYRNLPTWKQIRAHTGIADSTFKKKFKKTNNLKRDIVTAYEKWLRKNKPKSRNLKIIEKFLKGEDKPAALTSSANKLIGRKTRVYQKVSGKTYGKPLSFRNMMYEPTNEQGVVFLFGMVSEELGFSIEGIWVDFPDCEAKRIVNRTTGQQQRVKIEFEYKSKEFEKHIHEEQDCDLIVCWRDNWKECPIEVLDLSKAIKDLSNTKR